MGVADKPVLPATCPEAGCDAEVQASVTLYLTWNGDSWDHEGTADELAHISCEADHPIADKRYHDALSAFADQQWPGTTWAATDPRKGQAS